jgi:hypothetical protein
VSPGGPDDGPQDPVLPLAEMAAQITETYNAYVKAGMPPMVVAVMLGTWMGTLGGQAESP